MWFECGSIKSGPILEYPLVEHNSKHQLRPIWLNIRKVRGKRGWLLRKSGRFFAEDSTPEAMGHHALQVGEYAYELHTDEANQKYLMVQRLTGAQIWQPKLAKTLVGYSDLTDDEIAIEAIRAQSWMRGRQGGRYHVKHNNCQHFVEELWQRVCIKAYGMDNDSLRSLGKIACRTTDGYAPNLYFNIAFTAIFAISGLGFSHQACIWKNWRWFSLSLAAGGLMETGGYIGRILLHNDPFSDIGFKLNVVLLTIAPAFVSAGIYLTLKRLTRVFGTHLSRLSPSMYAWIFMTCDCVSIILQGAGGAISAIAESKTLLSLGVNLMIAGLAFQVFTLLVFFALAAEFFVQCLRNPAKLHPGSGMLAHSTKFQIFIAAVLVAFLCIFTRCCYRVAELSGGWGNSIMREESGFIICDSE
ncbi:hypothetical protein LTR36_001544 [Oleoguttula mirabilis]|uniref:Uncharacterized protein n=1 Tax=Oleoguttula mirabilis TaxID=1507867 RepID=A0AAV9JMN0_9PEZI|nr:hypothetical protein LTR36_001544 [Oleoguttula mirabilis]